MLIDHYLGFTTDDEIIFLNKRLILKTYTGGGLNKKDLVIDKNDFIYKK